MKARYEALDGLRGIAALSVVALHLCEVFRPRAAENPLHHGYLAVDFFYMLSGFVMAHAYDRRWPQMSLAGFLGQRLRRLHPLVILGVALGLQSYLIGRAWTGDESPLSPLLLLTNVALALLLLPAPSLPGHPGQTYSLDGPAWSLGQEYLANLFYGLVARRLGGRALAALAGFSGAALATVAAQEGTLHVGWNWNTLALAPLRTAFPFLAGLLLQRSGVRLRLWGGVVGLSLLLLAAFAAPQLSTAGAIKANGLLEAGLVIGLFPLVIAAGAACPVGGRLARLCTLSGALSYPLYIIHYPLVRLYAGWVWSDQAPHWAELVAGAGLFLVLPFAAWLALKAYDEPVRAWLAGVVRGWAPARRSASEPTASPG
jgi:peptidoglycan/LPS O-acetylase OafA/YrhL